MTLKPSSLILGGATFAESIYNGSDPPSEEMVDATIARAFEHGITTIDTSPWYYPSEERIGSALHRLTKQGTLSREQLIIMTKCGHFRPVDSSHEYDYSPSKIREVRSITLCINMASVADVCTVRSERP